jgi:hypothetical protein
MADVLDYRQRPRIETSSALLGMVVMALAQLGSLNALEQSMKRNRCWRGWVGERLPSADTIGNIAEKIDADSIRRVLKHVYTRLKRNKALKPVDADRFVLVIDGHESSSSYVRQCAGCLQRVIPTPQGDRVQYYHRLVMAQLVCGNFCLPLDMEPQRPGEGEVVAAERLLKRVLQSYPRAFSLIVADGLYLQAGFFKLAVRSRKEIIAVLKDERRDLLRDVRGLFGVETSQTYQEGNVTRECWDIEGCRSWESFGREIRVVRSLETNTTKRGRRTTEWLWAGTVAKERLSTKRFVAIAHDRWKIENNGFNELGNYWHVDHVYRHHPVAIEVFWLLTMLAYTLFHAFIRLNLKPAMRSKHTKAHWARCITAELYCGIYSIGIPP